MARSPNAKFTGQTYKSRVLVGACGGVVARPAVFLASAEQIVFFARLAFLIHVARRRAPKRAGVLCRKTEQAVPPNSPEDDLARAVSKTDHRTSVELCRHRLSVLQRVRVRAGVWLGGAHLPDRDERDHRRAGRRIRTAVTVNSAADCRERDRHA